LQKQTAIAAGEGDALTRETMTQPPEIASLLARAANALERLAPLPPPHPGWDAGVYIWDATSGVVRPAPHARALPLHLLQGIDGQKQTLLANTRRFAEGLPANDALLWGARGMGKSALVKAVHRATAGDGHPNLKLIEIHAGDLARLDALLALVSAAPVRAVIFCDDLAFTQSDSAYRAAKTLLEGGAGGRPPNAVFYATSNRRHLMPRDMSENERSTAIHPDEEAEERISLSDRFGLWLGFHACPQDVYLDIVTGYAAAFALPVAPEDLRARALAWSMGRSARSGRTAWQFVRDLAGELGVKIEG
jgi:uncharacterized protein